MGLLEIKNLTHSFGDKVLYKNVNFEIFKGEHVGLVGLNGTGKTTLLNSITGKTTPDSGEIRWQKGIKLGVLDQHAEVDEDITVFEYLKTAFKDLYELEYELNKIYKNMAEDFSEEIFNKASDIQNLLVNRGFYEIDSTILKAADGLGITAFGTESKLQNLSGGQRAKVILAKLLLENPDVMFLDEPTNFLDKEHVKWLADYLKSFSGAFIVISHDFEFLDNITSCILDIDLCGIKKYSCGLSKFLSLKELQKENYIREFKAQQKEIKKHEEYIAKNKVRASTAKMAKSRQKALDKIEKLDAPQTSANKPNFKFKSLPVSDEKALVVRNLKIGYDKPLLSNLNLEIKAGEKVVITGFNGIGKSTLLKTLIGEIPKLSGEFKFSKNVKVGYFEQDINWQDDSLTPIQIVSEKFPKLLEKEIRNYLAQCSVKANHVTRRVSSLSGGEQSKVKLCILMLTKYNFMILDEPTNHLDSITKEVLKKELQNFEGNLILVSHEAEFYKDWTDKVIDIKNNKL